MNAVTEDILLETVDATAEEEDGAGNFKFTNFGYLFPFN